MVGWKDLMVLHLAAMMAAKTAVMAGYLVEMMDSLKDHARESCLVAGMAVLKDSMLDTMLENRKDYLMGHY